MAHTAPAELLAPRDFLILMALADGRSHGYAILQRIAAETDGAVSMDPANLYRSLRRLSRDGLVNEHGPDTQRRRDYELTDAGRSALTAEASRLEQLVDSARTKRLLPASRR